MGTSLAYSMSSALRKEKTKREILLKIIKRTIILFSIGLILSNGKSGRSVKNFKLLVTNQKSWEV